MASIQARNVNHPEHRENLSKEKYTIIREAILAVLAEDAGSGGMTFQQLEEKVSEYLSAKNVSPSLFPKPGSVRWYTKAVQLDLEARQLIERVPNQSPIRLRKIETA